MKLGFIIFFLSFYSVSYGQDFKSEQLKYSRVRTAFDEKWDELSALITAKGFDPDRFKIFIRAFKTEQKLEVWVSSYEKEAFVFLKEYKIVMSSGSLGPKRKQGDLQVPEGFYKIDRFNPVSNFYLSLGINYPNQSDRTLGSKQLGGDIYIHGSNVTIGCMPLTDEKIKELYVLAVQAKNAGQSNIYIHIFPFEFKQTKVEEYKSNNNYSLWKNLKEGYDYFNQFKKIPYIQIAKDGSYNVK